MARAVFLFLGLLAVLLNLLSMLAFASGAAWLALQKRWMEVGVGVVILVGSAFLVFVANLACGELVRRCARPDATSSPVSAVCRSVGRALALAAALSLAGAVFILWPVGASRSAPPHLLFSVAVIGVACWGGGLAEERALAGRSSVHSSGLFTAIGGQIGALLGAACLLLNHPQSLILSLGVLFVLLLPIDLVVQSENRG